MGYTRGQEYPAGSSNPGSVSNGLAKPVAGLLVSYRTLAALAAGRHSLSRASSEEGRPIEETFMTSLTVAAGVSDPKGIYASVNGNAEY